jgi:diaminohydroxyphosphoribosylaminopyrimidine deaminase / 5-amino-6-(5-phosphoribosylamino)uracil reductase
LNSTSTMHAPSGGHTDAAYDALLRDLGEEAGEHRFEVAPNPCVGAAVLSEGAEVARGFHEVWGGAHAEVNAIAAAEAGEIPRERWDTLVVTLEPCSSRGKTPPCVEAILAAGFRRVVVAALDPDPRHRGRGLEILREKGVEVIVRERSAPLTVVSPHFVNWTQTERIRRPRPWLIAKWAQTRTGQLRPPRDVGEGRWISGPESLADVHLLRGRVDAILTGTGTMLADDPRLTVRPPGDLESRPLRVIIDSTLATSPDARIFREPGESASGGAVHIFTRGGPDAGRSRELIAAGAQIHPVVGGDDGRLSLREILGRLWEQGVRRVMLEAGPILLESMFAAGFVDQILVYTGDINGGRGPSMAEHLRPETLRQVRHREAGADALLDAFLR